MLVDNDATSSFHWNPTMRLCDLLGGVIRRSWRTAFLSGGRRTRARLRDRRAAAPSPISAYVDVLEERALLSATALDAATAANAVGSGNQIKNGDFELGNTLFGSDLNYDADAFGNNGEYNNNKYGIGTDPNVFFGSAPIKDHTRNDGTGQMLVAAPNASNRVWFESVALQTDTLYTIDLFAARLTPQVPATLSIEVDGASIGTLTLSNYSVWMPFHHTFELPSSTESSKTVTVAIRDLETSDFGNDFALDDISLMTTDRVTIDINNTTDEADDITSFKPDVSPIERLAQQLSAKITNNGAMKGTFELSVDPPGAATLNNTSVTLAAGASKDIMITPRANSSAANDVRIIA
ncbi:MAG: hypothetical protein EXS05_05530 [Planctomycetaceae bacterium]|nr:hypothetical protein [Planctomycetaceae bacterium]